MNEPPVDPRIERARALYVDSTVSFQDIAKRVGISKGKLTLWINHFGWPKRGRVIGRPQPPPPADDLAPPAPPPDAIPAGPHRPRAKSTPRLRKSPRRPSTKKLVDRIYRIITRNLETMESRMSDDEPTANDNPERDTRAIGNLVRSVEKLKELESEHSKRDAGSVSNGLYPLSPGEEDKLREEIVQRLLALRERMGDQATRR
jgi:hypothetical protein